MSDLNNQDAVDDFLAHYGVKGMQWGVRRSESGRVQLGAAPRRAHERRVAARQKHKEGVAAYREKQWAKREYRKSVREGHKIFAVMSGQTPLYASGGKGAAQMAGRLAVEGLIIGVAAKKVSGLNPSPVRNGLAITTAALAASAATKQIRDIRANQAYAKWANRTAEQIAADAAKGKRIDEILNR